MADYCEHGNEPSVSIDRGGFLEQLSTLLASGDGLCSMGLVIRSLIHFSCTFLDLEIIKLGCVEFELLEVYHEVKQRSLDVVTCVTVIVAVCRLAIRTCFHSAT
jgi:hypothetical protein